jgi:DNA-binding NarL/FixJ family response regulator
MKHQCYFTNKHIIDKLSITPEDQEQLSTIIGKKEKNRRYYFKNQDSIKAKLNSRYRPTKTANQMQRNIKKAKAKTLYKQGHSEREIALELKLNERTIRRYL